MQGLGRDIFWAYSVAAARVASWVIVYGVLFRKAGPDAAALLALVRWTLGLVNYASAGLAPAILHYAAKTNPEHSAQGFDVIASSIHAGAEQREPERPERRPGFVTESVRSIYLNAIALSWIGTGVGLIALWTWSFTQGQARGVATLVALFGTGMLIDLAADAWGAVIQSRGLIRRDYQAQTTLEITWAALAAVTLVYREPLGISWQAAVGGSYLVAALLSAALRGYGALRLLRNLPIEDTGRLDWRVMKQLLGFGGLVVVAQVADFLYAPTDLLLIRALIDLSTVAVYAPAVQMDAGILLLVSGLSIVILPISAAAFGRGELASVRRHYILGTWVSLLLLLLVSFLAWLATPAIFKAWLGNKMRPTQAILPLVFIHTVVGGSAAVGRSILLAMGKVKPFTIAALIAGVANVVLSYSFVRFFGMGLNGIILGTIVVVVARCAIWMPWYILRITSPPSRP